MPLYHFHLRTRDEACHPTHSRMLPNLAAALAEAQHAARDMIRSRMRKMCSAPSGTLEIEDEKGRPIARILLADVAQQIS
ncbi:DUF6894 family protein [Sphingomonas soli]|uniref:DUF6894 family protein n=1 Tax=Sphingomonas soli TaxID=266127 RepID=UPI0008304B7A|nr:hypothetical protein [Sphingomonas soli]